MIEDPKICSVGVEKGLDTAGNESQNVVDVCLLLSCPGVLGVLIGVAQDNVSSAFNSLASVPGYSLGFHCSKVEPSDDDEACEANISPSTTVASFCLSDVLLTEVNGCCASREADFGYNAGVRTFLSKVRQVAVSIPRVIFSDELACMSMYGCPY